MNCFAKNLLAGQHVVISGGLGALGMAIVEGFIAHGARVSVNDIADPSAAAEAFQKYGFASSIVAYTQADLTVSAEVERFVQRARQSFGPITTVLCHAGIVISSPLIEASADLWDRTFDVNLKSAFLLASIAAKVMIEDRVPGHLVFTSSWVSRETWPAIGPYSASKAAMNQVMRSFARELADKGIRANAVAPGIVAAGMAKKQWDTEPDYHARAQKAIPLGEMQSLPSVVDAFLFICSPAANYMTGSVLTVDGGCSLYPLA